MSGDLVNKRGSGQLTLIIFALLKSNICVFNEAKHVEHDRSEQTSKKREPNAEAFKVYSHVYKVLIVSRYWGFVTIFFRL